MRRSVLAAFFVLAAGVGPLAAQDAAPPPVMGGGLNEKSTSGRAAPAQPSGVKRVAIRAPRDIGYFQGDLVRASVDISVDKGFKLVTSSLPQPGPLNYWLDLRTIEVEQRNVGSTTRYTLKMLYQDFYVALDARQQEMPAFDVDFIDGKDKITAKVPPWSIGVSPLREISPAPKDDPKDFVRADEKAPRIDVDPLWISAAAAAAATLLALLLLAYDRLWWPFRPRPSRVFADAQRRLHKLAKSPNSVDAYLEALLVLHRGIDRTDGQRVLADDMPRFLARHPTFASQREAFARFFTASRAAFFGSDPQRAQADLGFGALQGFARQLAAIERAQP